MSRALFERGLKWRKERDAKIREKRKEKGLNVQFGAYVDGATVGDHIDSYWEYNRLVGEADNGELLSEKEYTKLKELAAKTSHNRLFVFWKCLATGNECQVIGPDSRCFCGHSYKAHAWYNIDTKKVHCRVKGCKCPCFDYVVGHGRFWIKCSCKCDHAEHVHNGVMKWCKRCRKRGKECTQFYSPYSCTCGRPWSEHATIFETKAERKALGKRVENLGMGAASTAAACGGLTTFSSLLPEQERLDEFASSSSRGSRNNEQNRISHAPLALLKKKTKSARAIGRKETLRKK